jgi:hypothetical protein
MSEQNEDQKSAAKAWNGDAPGIVRQIAGAIGHPASLKDKIDEPTRNNLIRLTGLSESASSAGLISRWNAGNNEAAGPTPPTMEQAAGVELDTEDAQPPDWEPDPEAATETGGPAPQASAQETPVPWRGGDPIAGAEPSEGAELIAAIRAAAGVDLETVRQLVREEIAATFARLGGAK